MNVTVFGLGFVGLTTALGFAHKGIKVYGIDINREKTDILKKGEIPFFEPEMDKILNQTLDKTFFITEDVKQAVTDSDYLFFCVGTPYGSNGAADLTFLFSAIDSALSSIQDEKYRVLVIKSTVPPSTTSRRVAPYVKEKYPNIANNIGVANNPEFLREGHCWDDFINADRIVLGCPDEKSANALKALYSGFDVPVFTVSPNTGEFIKYLSNTFLATMISYSNEMSLVADAVGDIDVKNAFRILHLDRRWGSAQMASYVYPGCGYGGYCLPKDTNALYAQAREYGFAPRILKEVIDLNDHMPDYIAQRIMSKISPENRIGILGLAFKPETDDVRDTPAAKVIAALVKGGYNKISAYDPAAAKEFEKHYSFDIDYKNSMAEVYEQSDIIVILTGWDEFKGVCSLGEKPVVDCRYIL